MDQQSIGYAGATNSRCNVPYLLMFPSEMPITFIKDLFGFLYSKSCFSILFVLTGY